MIVRPDKSFLKDYRTLKKNKALGRRLEAVLLQMNSAADLSELSSIKHLGGSYYRMRIGEYRLGFRMADGEVVVERFLHRKEMYRYYPPK